MRFLVYKNMQKTKYSKIEVPSLFNAPVDIVIPFHGQYEKVTALLESIYRYTRSNYITITLMDDCSPNETFLTNVSKNIQKRTNLFNAIRGVEQRGFAGASKVAFERTENPYVCLLNSDCLIEDGNWLRALGETLLALKSEGVRMVAPLTNNAVGGHDAQQGERADRSDDHVILTGEEHLSMYCVLCHRELFARCGGFLQEYPYGFYEDVEFAWRMRKYDFKQAVCRSSWVQHEGMATITGLWRKDEKIRTVMEEENHQRCLEDIKRL
jgi:GT2 family glycosyltransferase